MKNKKKVYVGMSGGVDSSVSAALLKKTGYDVTGVFIKVWQPDWITCTWREDRLDAMRVAAHLDIPFITLDLEKEYKREVVDYMIAEYKAGRTPNPDVMCNAHVKFGGFYDWAMKNGGDFVATGHYARIEKKNSRQSSSLLTGLDANKDQTYFLWTLKEEQLAHTLFPVGHLTKPEVRTLAKKFKLPTAEKKDSQGLCFIGKIDVKEFLSHYIQLKKGKVVNEEGEVIGEHDGAVFYTEGERHGFLITKKESDSEPMYVLAKNSKANTITVGSKERVLDEGKEEILLREYNWISEEPKEGKRYAARIRYRQALKECEVKMEGEIYRVVFKEKLMAVSSGQSLVLYDGDMCMGGGIIE